jgi:RimJ/RimL family protein N-acetyltransferase
LSDSTPQPILLDVPDQLTTSRLLLRVPRPGDSKFIWPAAFESQAELAPWMPWAYPQASEQRTEEWCRRAASSFFLREQFQFSLYLKGTETCVGSCGVPRLKWSVPSFEIGYWLRTSHCGQGLIAEAVGAVERMCFELFKAARVEIRCGAQNVRSRRVAERAGYSLEGILRHEERAPSGELRDQAVYAKIALPLREAAS